MAEEQKMKSARMMRLMMVMFTCPDGGSNRALTSQRVKVRTAGSCTFPRSYCEKFDPCAREEGSIYGWRCRKEHSNIRSLRCSPTAGASLSTHHVCNRGSAMKCTSSRIEVELDTATLYTRDKSYKYHPCFSQVVHNVCDRCQFPRSEAHVLSVQMAEDGTRKASRFLTDSITSISPRC